MAKKKQDPDWPLPKVNKYTVARQFHDGLTEALRPAPEYKPLENPHWKAGYLAGWKIRRETISAEVDAYLVSQGLEAMNNVYLCKPEDR